MNGWALIFLWDGLPSVIVGTHGTPTDFFLQQCDELWAKFQGNSFFVRVDQKIIRYT